MRTSGNAVVMWSDQSVMVGSTNHRFAQWTLDGARQPDSTNRAVNPVTGIVMSTSRTAVAVYMPQTRDSDGNGLPDWWDYNYFGDTGIVAAADSDSDGFSNLMEYQDASDPRDAGSVPLPPVILHDPLFAVRTSPAQSTLNAHSSPTTPMALFSSPRLFSSAECGA